MEKPVKKTKKKKQKNKKMNGISTEKSSSEVVPGAGPRKYVVDEAMKSKQSSKEETEHSEINSEKCSRNNTQSAGDSSVHIGRELSECSHVGVTDLTGNRFHVGTWNCNCSESRTNCKGLKMSKHRPEELSSNFRSSETLNIMSCKVEDCNGCRTGNTTTRSDCFSACNPSFKFNTLTSQHDAEIRTNHVPVVRNGKENRQLIWQKKQKNVREAQIHGAKRSNFKYKERDNILPEKNFEVNPNSLASEGLLPTPLVSSSGHYNAAYGSKRMGSKQSLTYRSVCGKVLTESSQWDSRPRLIGLPSQYVLQSSEVDTCKTEDFDKLAAKSNHPSKHENNCNRTGVGGYGTNLRLRNKSGNTQKESLWVPFNRHHYRNSYAAQGIICNSHHVATQGPYSFHSSSAAPTHLWQSVPCSTKLGVPAQGVFDELQPNSWMKIPRMEHASGSFSHASIYSEPWLDIKLHNKNNFRQDVSSRTNSKKWIPISAKEFRMQERTGSASTCSDFDDCLTVSRKGKNDSFLERLMVPCSGHASLRDFKSTRLISSHNMTSVNFEPTKFESLTAETKGQRVESAKDYVTSGKQLKDAPQFLIFSQMVREALNAAYKLQLASERVWLATGYPLAEFERLLHSTAPVIASSYAYEKCDVCLDKRFSYRSLCKHQIPSASLRTVWNWYEKPGNYGLEFKAEDSDSISFHAHFVPFLSAVQLFGYPQLSNCCGSTEHINSKMDDKGKVESLPSPKTKLVTHSSEAVQVNHIWAEDIKQALTSDSVEEHVSSVKIHPCSGSDSPSSVSSPACFNDTELIFEFFESELPQQRKPLLNKILELIGAGTSNNQVFGDPSKLECLNLRDLHPASWFSVAWYPIYRIPEGNFRASFLTYHSLGHLVQRCNPSDSLNRTLFCIISPVLGLQSYNAQGECWLDLKVPVGSSLTEFTHFNRSEIFKERLRTLEENALLFSRGCVYKDHVKVFNRHRDYEFFISRKYYGGILGSNASFR